MNIKTKSAIKIWGRLSSSNVQAVLWCLAELHLPFERINAGYIHGVVDSPEYLAMNPNGLVPTLIDGDGPPLFETGAILRYLAGQYAPESFWPTDAVQRAQTDKWTEWAKINIALKFTAPVFWLVVRTAPSRQDPETIAANLNVLEKYDPSLSLSTLSSSTSFPLFKYINNSSSSLNTLKHLQTTQSTRSRTGAP